MWRSGLTKPIELVPFPEPQKKQKSNFVVPFNWVFANDNILYKDTYEKKEERTKFKKKVNYEALTQSLIQLEKEVGINDQEYERKFKYYQRLKMELKKNGINNTIFLTGSLYTQLGLKNSDLDIGFLTDTKEDNKIIAGKLKSIFEEMGLTNIMVNDSSHTRVCLCNFYDTKEDIKVDISINSEGVKKNVQLFKLYDLIDDRFRILVIAIKYWIKQRGIDKGTVIERMSENI
ncbi:hypothetical protein PIROE2DRAFT_64740 [Piromyces sp. E2]|nr:hypothetical protein PIROE2DRAFT_64740 [Piromyces sp. E2]|eukprot:OUM57908.1 hypothetical protein PIROE2DRAFT_64740 [Piromyces sp. E2]